MTNIRTETKSNLGNAPAVRRVTPQSTQRQSRPSRESYEPPGSDIGPDCSQCTYAGCQGPPATPDLVVASSVNRNQSVPANGSMLPSTETCPFLRSLTIPIFAGVHTDPGKSISIRQDNKAGLHAAKALTDDVE